MLVGAGEDPVLSGRYGTAYVRGLQTGDDKRYLKLSATLKHFDAYSLENSNGTDRYHFNAVVSAQDLQQTYFPAFKAAVEKGGAMGVMCSYNSVNGVCMLVTSFCIFWKSPPLTSSVC